MDSKFPVLSSPTVLGSVGMSECLLNENRFGVGGLERGGGKEAPFRKEELDGVAEEKGLGS
jgi:hypothetical protein